MGSSAVFERKLKFGKIGESIIGSYFRNKGFIVLPIYEKEISEGKGPALYFPKEEIIATDMFVFRRNDIRWIEAKHKSVFTWHRNSETWTTGIDMHHYEQYRKIDKQTPWPVGLVFHHEGGYSETNPPDKESPSGIHGNSLEFLSEDENIHHTWGKYGKGGMIYWAIDKLKLMATKDQLK